MTKIGISEESKESNQMPCFDQTTFSSFGFCIRSVTKKITVNLENLKNN